MYGFPALTAFPSLMSAESMTHVVMSSLFPLPADSPQSSVALCVAQYYLINTDGRPKDCCVCTPHALSHSAGVDTEISTLYGYVGRRPYLPDVGGDP